MNRRSFLKRSIIGSGLLAFVPFKLFQVPKRGSIKSNVKLDKNLDGNLIYDGESLYIKGKVNDKVYPGDLLTYNNKANTFAPLIKNSKDPIMGIAIDNKGLVMVQGENKLRIK